MKDRDIVSEIHIYGLDVKNREIYLNEFDDSGESAGVDHRMLQTFLKNIRILNFSNKTEPATIHLQTIGGCWYAGMGIYDAITSCEFDVSIIGYSQVCSMGTVIMQAADKRLLCPNAVFMCHFGSTDASGDYQSSQNYSALDKKNAEKMLSIYAEKCSKTGQFFLEREYNVSKTKQYIKRKLKDGDWYLSAEEAVYYGFVDGIAE
jgi:ATP-dependent Clp protease, protease subunit